MKEFILVFMVGIGMLLAGFAGCTMDSPDITIPVISAIIGIVLMAPGIIYFHRKGQEDVY